MGGRYLMGGGVAKSGGDSGRPDPMGFGDDPRTSMASQGVLGTHWPSELTQLEVMFILGNTKHQSLIIIAFILPHMINYYVIYLI